MMKRYWVLWGIGCLFFVVDAMEKSKNNIMVEIKSEVAIVPFTNKVVAYETLSCDLASVEGYVVLGATTTKYGYIVSFPEGDRFIIQLLRRKGERRQVRALNDLTICKGLRMRTITQNEADAILYSLESQEAKFDCFYYPKHKDEAIFSKILAYLKNVAEK